MGSELGRVLHMRQGCDGLSENVLRCAVCVILATACNSEPARVDARPVDARSDAMTSCTEYPDLGVQLCPSYQPYCCAIGHYQFCSADSKMDTCMEHPV